MNIKGDNTWQEHIIWQLVSMYFYAYLTQSLMLLFPHPSFSLLGKNSLFFFSQAKPSISSILSTFLQEPSLRSTFHLSTIYFLSYSLTPPLDPSLLQTPRSPAGSPGWTPDNPSLSFASTLLIHGHQVPMILPMLPPLAFSLLAHLTILLAINLPFFHHHIAPFLILPLLSPYFHPRRALSSPCMSGSIYPSEKDLSRCLII